jgi:AcrR family transcriptional regulator
MLRHVTEPPLGNARAPMQARSLATFNRILTAASAILDEGDWDAFTIEAVAGRAEVSVGAIYRRFGDKEGLFKAVHEAHLVRFAERAREIFDPVGWADEDAGSQRDARTSVHDAVVRLGSLFEELGSLNGILMVNANRFPGLGNRGAAVMNELRDEVIAILRAHAPRGGPRSEVSLAICYRLAFATFVDFASSARFPSQAHEMSWATLIDEVACACTSYLFD